MEETILFPSPNWFQASGFAVSRDGWLIYGGPSKSLCVLEPLPADSDGILLGTHHFKAHVLNRAHPDKIVCVDISPDWPEKRDILVGSCDGLVKQWTLEQVDNKWKLKGTQSHDKHQHDKEEVAGVAYSHDSYAITVGSYGNLVKWDIKSNVVKVFKNLKGFRPSCLSCSPHIPLNVAVGTKQGVVFVIDLTGAGKTVYKVRGQDEEITNVSWCPQYEVLLKKALGNNEKKEKISVATQRMMKIRHLTEEEKLQLSECENSQENPQENIENEGKEMNIESEKIEEVKLLSQKQENAQETLEENEDTNVEIEKTEVKLPSQNPEDKANLLEDSGIVKNLPEDSFDETIVLEDDMFDIYKDHEADEFGHKKYQPEDIVIKVKKETKPDDYLAECLKLKDEILKRKNQQDETMESLVNALDEAHLDMTRNVASTSDSQVLEEQKSAEGNEADIAEQIVREGVANYSVHVHKHLLATVSKFGSVRIWSKSGKLVGSCAVPSQGNHNKNPRMKSPTWGNILWYKSDVLLIADGKNQLLECNPLKIDCRNRLAWNVLHSYHKRVLFSIATDAPRVQSADQSYDQFSVWTVSQDRDLIRYSHAKKQKLATHATCGGFVYSIQQCPYAAGKIAVSVSDGAVRVWETEASPDETKLSPGKVTMFWQHVQGKVLCVAWHPRTENLLAFSTAESRVGLIDTGAKSDNRTRNLLSALNGHVYSICWGEDDDLYACGGGNLVKYKANRVDEAPAPIEVSWEGQRWAPSAALWRPAALLVGALAGGVALLAPHHPHTVLAAVFAFGNIIHTMDWHPQQTSSSSEDSPLKNLIAVCSMDKQNTIVILEYVENEDGNKQLNTWKTLSGHTCVVHQVLWSPHDEGLLLSTSKDTTVRIWDVVSGVNTHTLSGHGGGTLAGGWSAYPGLRAAVLSGGSDGCLRLWDYGRHPARLHVESTKETATKKKKQKRAANKTEEAPEQDERETENVAATQDSRIKASKRFLLPVLTKQMTPCSIQGVRKMLQKYLEKKNGDITITEAEDMEQSYNVNYIKIFGSIKEVNELLDAELERHEDTGHWDAWYVLSLVRGHVDAALRRAAARDALCPFLLSMAPCVSLKYWKDASELYLAQIDRLVAKGEEHKLCDSRPYGGPALRAACVRLAVHDVRGAVRALADAKLYKEAYVLCRVRYMDSIAEEVLNLWANDCFKTGMYGTAAVCQIALGNLSEAANILSKSKDENWLSLAAELAKIVGQTTFADHIAGKQAQIKNNAPSDPVEEEIEKLPSRVELLMKESAKRDDMKEKAPGDIDYMKEEIQGDKKDDMKEEGQGDIKDDMKEEGQGDIKDDAINIIKDNNNEKGQGDMECGVEDNPVKDNVVKESTDDVAGAKENGVEKVEVLNGDHMIMK